MLPRTHEAAPEPLRSEPAAGRIGVVIPFFQRSPGLLERALCSVLEQESAGELEVVVVDDGSPLPAMAELEAWTQAERARVRIVRQPNAGPGAARNRALDLLDPGVELIAFLDSDDWWGPAHLARARRALGAGHDIYVSNWMPLEADVDAYAHFQKLDLGQHEPLDRAADLWRYRGDFFLQELTRPIGRLSTMVLRRAPFADLRFETRLTCAFEDRLYRLEMARRAPSIAFSTRPEVFSGEGVNVFSSKTWGTPGRLDVARDDLLAARLVRRRFRLSPAERECLANLVRTERRDALTTFARLLVRERRLELRRLGRILAQDPLFPLMAPLACLGLAHRP